MSNKTIAKFCAFVISFAVICIFFSSCSFDSQDGSKVSANSVYETPLVTGKIKSSEITESSGIAASKCQKNVLWTHNDSGDGPFIFAINAAGDDLGTWKLPGAENLDWEDIATLQDKGGKCFIYIGEIGDNRRKRSEHIVYRIPEPVVSGSDRKSSRQDPIMTENAGVLKFSYPDQPQDAETLMVHPKTGDIYVLSKRASGPAGIYRIKPVFDNANPVVAEKIGEIAVPSIPNGFLTGGDISPDGKRVIICDYTGGYELTLPDNAANFDAIWKQKPQTVDLGDRPVGESVCYSPDGMSLIATSEGKNSPVIEIKRRK